MGYGVALRTGIAAAKMEYVFFTDADLQFDFVELQHLLLFVPDFKVVVGYRAPRHDPSCALSMLSAGMCSIVCFLDLKPATLIAPSSSSSAR